MMLSEAARSIWLPLHHSIRHLSFEYQVDGNYLRELAQRLGFSKPKLVFDAGME